MSSLTLNSSRHKVVGTFGKGLNRSSHCFGASRFNSAAMACSRDTFPLARACCRSATRNATRR